MINKLKAALLSSAMLAAPVAIAGTTYEYNQGPGEFAFETGAYDSIHASYNDWTNVLSWETDNVTNGDGLAMDGFWLVINNGTPIVPGDELAIFYADFEDSDGAGNGDNRGLWAFEYNQGEWGGDVSSHGTSFGDFTSALVDDGTTKGFSLDVSGIYSQIASSQPFDAGIGLWFYPSFGTQSSIDPITGRLTAVNTDNFRPGIDVHRGSTTQTTNPTNPTAVSEPATLGLVLLGAAGLMSARRRNK